MMPRPIKLLVVDDEPFNIEIIAEHLEGAGYELVTAADGQEAWQILQGVPGDEFDALILDRMMPNMDGMELLKRVKQEVRFRQVPVIMQTAAASAEQVAEGLRNGAYYYLTKPFDGMVLASVVRAAVADGSAWRDMARSANQEPRTLILMQQARFRFRSLDDARVLAASLAQCLPDPTNMGLGLLELLVNAVEHGNVEITCEEKSRLLRADAWEEEVVRRLALPEYADRWVDLEYQRTDAGIEIVVRDDGAGFDWQSYQELDPKRAFEPNGRGIALARQLCFPALEYLGNGNTVRVKIPHGSAAA